MYVLTFALAGHFPYHILTGGGGDAPPWRLDTRRRSASQQRQVDCSRRVLAICAIFFTLGSTFDRVKGQFSGKSTFFQLIVTQIWQISP